MGFNSTVASWEGGGDGLLIEVTVLGLREKGDIKINFFLLLLKVLHSESSILEYSE